MQIWQEKTQFEKESIRAIAETLNLTPAIARLLCDRVQSTDIEICRDFLEPERYKEPEIAGIPEAVEIVKNAIKNHRKILVFGDYDTDGITAVVLLESTLLHLKANVCHIIPSRSDGYGLTDVAVKNIIAEEPSLLITVDCGITAVKACEEIKAAGITTIITDHHTRGNDIPQVESIILSNEICGCAVAYRLARAIAVEFNFDISHYLDIVAIATLADVMSLTQENRKLTTLGLQKCRGRARRGLTKLFEKQKLCKNFSAEDLSFKIIPCLNAAGRIGNTKYAYQLLRSTKESTIKECVEELFETNQYRKELEKELFEQLDFSTISGNGVVFGGEDFHEGIIGIVAARVVDKTGLTAAIIKRTANGGHGSLRAAEGTHALHALEKCEDLLKNYGGHSGAAGFTLNDGCYEEFCKRFPTACEKPEKKDFVQFDMWLDDSNVSMEFIREISRLEPFGNGNPKPLFGLRNVMVTGRKTCGENGNHLLLFIQLSNGVKIKGFYFFACVIPEINGNYDLIVRLSEDSYNGVSSPLLNITAIREAQ